MILINKNNNYNNNINIEVTSENKLKIYKKGSYHLKNYRSGCTVLISSLCEHRIAE